MQGKLLKVEEVAQILGISISFAYQLMREGRIRCVHVGRSRRVSRKDLEQFISENAHGGSGILNGFQVQHAHGSEVTGVKSDAHNS